MILGMSTAAFTLLHVALSLIGMMAGAVVVYAMCKTQHWNGWTALFLSATVATTATGFLFHSAKFGPAHVIGVISLVVLALAILALYAYRLAGPWRWLYVVAALSALYLNVFVGIVQAFQKLPSLRPLAPTQSEPPFIVTQLVVFLAFIALGAIAAGRFHPQPHPAGSQ
jgi:hypothetical protein